jgi:hypothetical protein
MYWSSTDGYMLSKSSVVKGVNFDDRKAIRQAKSAPIFEKLSAWIKAQSPKVTSLGFNYLLSIADL